METRKILLTGADCALDLGDGSERGLYVNQDYILQKMKKVHRGISLMYTYYPKDKTWPKRACNAFETDGPVDPWSYPYENYFPYLGGTLGMTDGEPFNFMKEIRQHGMDVVLTLTIDPNLTEEDIIPIAKDLQPYGRVFLRVNHECTGDWFCYTKRASYEKIAEFFVMVCKVMHKYAPNVLMILCAGMWQEETGKLEMEDIFLEAHKQADIWSGDQYLSLNWGWPVDLTCKTNSHACYSVKKVYEKAKNTWLRLKEITGQDKPMVLSELNADGDVTGPYKQAEIMTRFMELVEKDKEKWLSAFTLYQFRDDGRLGLEITDPNNNQVGIEQPLLSSYREKLFKPFFSQKIVEQEECKLPLKLRWSNSEDATGFEIPCLIEKNPCYAEIFFNGELRNQNLMIEIDGYWYYKKPGVLKIDFMSYFFDRKIKKNTNLKIRFFAPPADGMNHPGEEDWMNSSYTEIKELPEIRIEYEPVEFID